LSARLAAQPYAMFSRTVCTGCGARAVAAGFDYAKLADRYFSRSIR
jgi:hypothetical protein